MKVKLAAFPFFLVFFSGCAAMVPALIGSGGTAAFYYYREKAEGVYRVPLEDAYPVAVRTLDALNLKIAAIEVGEKNRIISAKDSADGYRSVTFTLEVTGPDFTRATIRAINHDVIPDGAYGMMVLQTFTNEIARSPQHQNKKQIMMGRR